MGCGVFFVKYLLFIANLFFALAGLALLGIGIAVELRVSAVTDLLSQHNVSVAPILTIVVGIIVFLSAFFGCCGAIRESNCMLVTYAIFMLILTALGITLATLILVNLDAFIDDIPQSLNEAFTTNSTRFSEAIESTFQCCGTTGAAAYQNAPLPSTCCNTPPCTLQNAYNGCNGIIEHFASVFGYLIAAFVIAVAVVELVTVAFSLCLANTIRNKGRREQY